MRSDVILHRSSNVLHDASIHTPGNDPSTWGQDHKNHHSDVTMSIMASQITGDSSFFSRLYRLTSKKTSQSRCYWPFVRGIYRWRVDSPHKGPVKWKPFPFGDDIMTYYWCITSKVTLSNNAHFYQFRSSIINNNQSRIFMFTYSQVPNRRAGQIIRSGWHISSKSYKDMAIYKVRVTRCSASPNIRSGLQIIFCLILLQKQTFSIKIGFRHAVCE